MESSLLAALASPVSATATEVGLKASTRAISSNDNSKLSPSTGGKENRRRRRRDASDGTKANNNSSSSAASTTMAAPRFTVPESPSQQQCHTPGRMENLRYGGHHILGGMLDILTVGPYKYSRGLLVACCFVSCCC